MKLKIAWFVIGVLVAAVVVFLIQALVTSAQTTTAIRGTQKTNTVKTDNTAETLKLVKDCVTPSGACFKRGQAETAGAVTNINRVVVLAASCASGPTPKSAAQIQTCVLAGLSHPDH